MKLKNYFSLAVFILAFSCSRNEFVENNSPSMGDPMSNKEINEKIDSSLKDNGGFDWKNSSDYMLWSAIIRGGNNATIGFGESGNDFVRSSSKNNVNIESEILEIIKTNEKSTIEKILVNSDGVLNYIDVKISNPETIIALRKNGHIRYIEPTEYPYQSSIIEDSNSSNNDVIYSTNSSVSSGSGCGYGNTTLSTADYTTVAPGALVPWSFTRHNIPAAWAKSTGQNVTVGIIDTGVSPVQTLLGNSFNVGYSSGRSIQKYGLFNNDGANDGCGHGTSMASVLAAPRNNKNLPTGVAYNSNLITYRAASDVVLDSNSEAEAVKNAFIALGNNTNVKIISMSMGFLLDVGKIKDGVRYAYNKGKLIFCAGGTSISLTAAFYGVIFPANMAECIAVTGVKEGTANQRCNECHKGSQIMFTVQMQRNTGKTVPVNSYYNNLSNYVGGSSVATATTAGIAALVWSKYPSWTRTQILSRLISSSTYSTKDSQYGYGNIDAYKAVQ